MLRTVCFILTGCLAASNASAVLTAQFGDPVDNSAVLTGYVTQDLMITTSVDDNWGTAQVLATLTAGSLYQDPNGSNFAPNPALFPAFPTLEFDSFVDGFNGQPGVAGGAVDLGGAVSPTFNESLIDITWYDNTPDSFGTFRVARFTATDDAVGTWNMLVSSTSGVRTYEGSINNGIFDLRQTSGGQPVVGDLDEDLFVGLTDLDIILGDWNGQITPNPAVFGDIDFDHFVGLQDLDVVLANWGTTVLPGDSLQGELTGDIIVGLDDLDVILGNWGMTIPTPDTRADVNFDNFIGLDDLDVVLANWNNGIPPSSPDGTSIPEPGTAALTLACLALALSRRSA